MSQDLSLSIQEGASLPDDSDERWDLIAILHREPAQRIVPVALKELRSPDPEVRAFAVDVLAQCVDPDDQGARTGPDARFVAHELQAHADRETDAGVIGSLAYAAGHIPDNGWLTSFRRWSGDTADAVRFAVASALSAQIATEGWVALAIKLSRDGDSDVRDWAAFALAAYVSDTHPEIAVHDRENIRDRLLALAEDESDLDVVSEAVRGLVALGDPVGERTFRRLEAEGVVAADFVGLEDAAWMLSQRTDQR